MVPALGRVASTRRNPEKDSLFVVGFVIQATLAEVSACSNQQDETDPVYYGTLESRMSAPVVSRSNWVIRDPHECSFRIPPRKGPE